MKLVLDPHTHSIASVHAYSTIAENARYSADIGLELIGITDHAPAMPGVNTGRYFFNLRAVPDFLFGVEIMCGAEFNILNFEGEMDIPQEHKETYDIGIASLHRPCIAPGSVEENTAALVNAAAAGLGVAVVPRRMVEENIARGEVAEIFVEGLRLDRKYKLVRHREKKLSRAAEAFMALCRSFHGEDEGGDRDAEA